MKKFLLFIGLQLFTFSAHAIEKYQFDNTHSYVVWSVSHFDFSDVTGKYFVDGELLYDKLKPQNSKVTITVPIKNGTTGIEKLDNYLVSRNYFDAEQFSTATFVSNRIEINSSSSGKVYGTLTIRNISKPLVLTVNLKKQGISPVNHKMTMGFYGKGTLKRSDFGLRAYIPGVSDRVELTLQAEANKVDTDTLGTSNDEDKK